MIKDVRFIAYPFVQKIFDGSVKLDKLISWPTYILSSLPWRLLNDRSFMDARGKLGGQEKSTECSPNFL